MNTDIDKWTTELVNKLKKGDVKQIFIYAIPVFILGIILLSFTFILPILVFAAALAIIAFIVFIVYKFIGGK